jgi:glutamyl endopeptidase
MASSTRSRGTRTSTEAEIPGGDFTDNGVATEGSGTTVPIPAVFAEADISSAHAAVSSEADGGGGADAGIEDDFGGRGSGARGEMEQVPGYDAGMLTAHAPESAALEEDMPLDAWYASVTDPAELAMLQRPEVIERIAEVVIGVDDRTRITATTSNPWRWICALRIKAKDGSNWIGTGWLVGPRTVITAGHCIFIHNRGGWVSSVEVIPGMNGAQRPYGSGVATSFRSVSGWTQNQNRNFDYGAIILPSNKAFGNQLGFFGYAALGDSSLQGITLNLSGYPGDKPSGTQWFHARAASALTARTIVYNIDTAGGQSGSPVWRVLNGQRHAVGIHTNGSPSGNSATRIVKEVFDNIKMWKAQGS